MKHLSRLNGWQRIGALLTSAWLLFVIGYVTLGPRTTDGLLASTIFRSEHTLSEGELKLARKKHDEYWDSFTFPEPTEAEKLELQQRLTKIRAENPALASWLTSPTQDNDPNHWGECENTFNSPVYCPTKSISIRWAGLATALFLPPVSGWGIAFLLIIAFTWVRDGFRKSK